LVYNNPNVGECTRYVEPVCVVLPEQRDGSHAPDQSPIETNMSQTREPAEKQVSSQSAHEQANNKPAHEWATTKPAREWAKPQPAHEGGSSEPTHEQASQPSTKPVPTLSAQGAPAPHDNQPASGLDDELDDSVADLAAQYKATSFWITFVENFRGNEGCFHADVKSVPHVVAPLLDHLQVTGAPVALSTPPWKI
jgi:hypothetical protein